jgi:hypothetical protein
MVAAGSEDSQPAPPPPVRRIYVIAGNHREFLNWCYDNKVNRSDRRYVYISDFSRLRGFHIEESMGDRVVLYGTYEHRMDWPLMVEELKVVWRD